MSELTRSGASSRWSMVWGVLLIMTGILAVGWPLFAAVAISRIAGWLIVLAGIEHIIYAFHAKSAGSAIWDILVGIAYIVVGVYVLAHPFLAVTTLTFLLALLFFAEGVLEILGYLDIRHRGGSGWLLLDGIITAVIGVLIWAHWPSSSAWALGLFVGVSMIISGFTRVMMSLAFRRLAARAM